MKKKVTKWSEEDEKYFNSTLGLPRFTRPITIIVKKADPTTSFQKHVGTFKLTNKIMNEAHFCYMLLCYFGEGRYYISFMRKGKKWTYYGYKKTKGFRVFWLGYITRSGFYREKGEISRYLRVEDQMRWHSYY